jgi:hypothetical protein
MLGFADEVLVVPLLKHSLCHEVVVSLRKFTEICSFFSSCSMLVRLLREAHVCTASKQL